MAKPTGFLEFRRATPTRRPVQQRTVVLGERLQADMAAFQQDGLGIEHGGHAGTLAPRPFRPKPESARRRHSAVPANIPTATLAAVGNDRHPPSMSALLTDRTILWLSAATAFITSP